MAVQIHASSSDFRHQNSKNNSMEKVHVPSLHLLSSINPLSTNPTKWSNTLKQFGNHFVVLELKGLSKGSKISKYVIFM